MKVVQINTVSGRGSTGRICVDIATKLEPYGVQTLIAYGHGVANYKNTYKIGSFIENKFHSIYSRLIGKQSFASYFATRRFIKFLKTYNPDVIHLNNLHGNYINLPLLLEYITKYNINTVWTIHDCWPYTGKCAHYVNKNCERWKNGCGNCPNLNTYPPTLFFDFTASVWEKKKELYSKLRNTIMVAVSDWIKKEAQQSILSHLNIVRIYNWIDTTVFSPMESNNDIFTKYNICKDKFIVLGVCGRFSKAKGYDSWVYLSEHLSKDFQIVLVGNLENGKCPENIVHIPYVYTPQELAYIYSLAGTFCNLSEAESFGKTTAEALSCGTPIIVYNTTACPELVGDNCGYVCRLNAPEDVLEKLLQIKNNGKSKYSASCRQFALDNFSDNNIFEFLSIYKSF